MARYRFRYFIDCWAGDCLWSANEEAKEKYGYPVILSKLGLSERTVKKAEEIMRRAYQMACTTPDVYGVSYEFSDEEKAAHRKEVGELLITLRHELGPDYEIIDES